MRIEKATIEFENGIVEYPGMKLIDLAHELIKQANPQSEILITESLIQKFRDEAKQEYVTGTKLFTDYEAYQELYVRMKVEMYKRVEHAKNSYNDAVMSFAPMKKKVFHFDFWTGAEKDANGKLISNLWTQSITAWDEEHATLLFEKMHPGKSFDPPY